MTLKEQIKATFGTQAEFARVVKVNIHTVKRWVLAGEICVTMAKGLMAKRLLDRRLRAVGKEANA